MQDGQNKFYFFLFAAISAAAVNNTSVDELSAVSQESWITPIINPTPTTCIAKSLEIPNREHASGIKSNEPPATPEAPHALTADRTHNIIAVPRSTETPSVLAAANVKIDMVTAAPPMLMVAPRGIDIEYVSLSRPSSSQSLMFTGMFAAELLVKNAVIQIGRAHV